METNLSNSFRGPPPRETAKIPLKSYQSSFGCGTELRVLNVSYGLAAQRCFKFQGVSKKKWMVPCFKDAYFLFFSPPPFFTMSCSLNLSPRFFNSEKKRNQALN